VKQGLLVLYGTSQHLYQNECPPYIFKNANHYKIETSKPKMSRKAQTT